MLQKVLPNRDSEGVGAFPIRSRILQRKTEARKTFSQGMAPRHVVF
jgi:hypothetical protein